MILTKRKSLMFKLAVEGEPGYAGWIATDEKGVIQIFNVGAERMLGYSALDVVNRITPADFHDPQELIARAAALSVELGTPITPGFEALVFKAARGIEDIYELTKIRKDGSRFAAIVSVTSLRDAQENIIGYLFIGTDNTARKQIEAERALLDQRLRDQQFYTRSLIESNIDAIDLNSLLSNSLSIVREKAAAQRIRLELETGEDMGVPQLDMRTAGETVTTLLNSGGVATMAAGELKEHIALVIEDDDRTADLVRLLLEAEGFTVLRAASAEAALLMARGDHPNLILMDIQLAGMDGLAATGLLKQDPATAAIPIIAVTAMAMKADREKSLLAGCDAYIAKPLRYQELYKAIDTLLVKRELQAASERMVS